MDNNELRKQKQREYYAKNKERIAAHRRKYYERTKKGLPTADFKPTSVSIELRREKQRLYMREYNKRKNQPKEVPTRKYIKDNRLTYEIILSKGKGYATEKLKLMLYKITYNLNTKFYYKDEDQRYDIMMESYYDVLRKWIHFDENKYNKSLPYISEVLKRSHAKHFNLSKAKGMVNFDNEIISINDWY